MNEKTLCSETENLLSDLESATNRINENFYVIETKVISLIKNIKESAEFKDCQVFFNKLEVYYTVVDRAKVKYDFEISNKLKQYLADFIRLDDHDSRRHLWKLISSGKYKLEQPDS